MLHKIVNDTTGTVTFKCKIKRKIKKIDLYLASFFWGGGGRNKLFMF